MENTFTEPHRGRLSRRNTIFLSMFGVSIGAFALGFDDCLFDVNTVDACIAHSQSWIPKFQSVGDHLIKWFIALITAAF